MQMPGAKVTKKRKQRKDEEKHAARLLKEAEIAEESAPPPPAAILEHVPIKQIIIGKRFREKYDVEDLVESIKDKGVIQPITLDIDLNLLAGGRRIAAAVQAGLESIPALIRPASSELDNREIELIENVQREDLTWQERTKLTKEIDDLYTAKYGVRSAGVGQGWSGRKTAELLSRSHGSIQRTLALAEGMSLIPDIALCKTEHEAFKMLKGIEESMLVRQLRKDQQTSLEGHVPVSEEEFQESLESVEDESERLKLTQERFRETRITAAAANFRVGNALEEMRELAELYTTQESPIRFIECDPPFGISLHEQKKRTNKDAASHLDQYEEVAEEDYRAFLWKTCELLHQIANKNCWLIFWYGPSWTAEVLTALEAANWQVDHIPAVWVKGEEESEGTGQTGSPERYLARATEFFFVCRKGAPLLTKEGRTNVFSFKPTPPSKKYHPTQKPLPLYQELLKTFAFPGSVLCSPFLGSGSALRAAYLEGMVGLGWDLNSKNRDRFLIAVEDDLDAQIREIATDE